MIRLRLLGGAELHGPDGAEITDVLNQPKRFALLALLAASPGARLYRRDSLLALFWPELDDERARAALRRALHFLRRYVGADVVRTRGEEVGVAPDACWCDVAACDAALAEGELERALELYRGDLLEGFHVPSAPGFERWLDETRERLRRAVADGAWRLAEQEESAGRPASAARWARRAVTLQPDDEAGLRRLLVLLDRSGDRAAALQVYDEFARRLASDMELTPSPDTAALVAGLRAPTRLAGQPAGAAPAAPPSPNRVAIFPFVVRGRPELEYLREGMVDLLGTKLDGAGDVRTVDPHATLAHAAPFGRDGLPPAQARAVAERLGAGAFMLGSIVAAEPQLLVRATLYETRGDGEVRVDAEAGAEGEIFAAVDELVRRLLASRTTSLGSHLARLGAMTTESLPAIKTYLEGERALRQGRATDARRAYERAVDADPRFALALYRLGAALLAGGAPEPARAATARATAASRDLTAHTRQLLSAQAAWLDGDVALAERRCTTVLQERPDDVEAWYRLGTVLLDGGPFRGRSPADAQPAFEQTCTFDPRHAAAVAGLARLAAVAGDPGAAAELASRYLALSPDGDDALAMHVLRTRPEADPIGAIERAPARAAGLAGVLADLGCVVPDLRAALDDVRRLSALPAARGLGPLPALVTAHLAAAVGDAPAQRRALDAAAAQQPWVALVHEAFLATRPGGVTDADALARLRDRLAGHPATPGAAGRPALDPHETVREPLRLYLLGLVHAAAGVPADAERCAAHCESAAAPEWATSLPTTLARGVRARVQVETGNPAAACEILEGLPLGPWMHLAPASPCFALTHERFLYGQALRAASRTEEARGWLAGIGTRCPFDVTLRADARALTAARA